VCVCSVYVIKKAVKLCDRRTNPHKQNANPVDVSQTLIVLSRDEETTKSPEGMNRTHEMVWSCPGNVLMQLNDLKSHNFIVKSLEPGNKRENEHFVDLNKLHVARDIAIRT
jgi:hypothetical protein